MCGGCCCIKTYLLIIALALTKPLPTGGSLGAALALAAAEGVGACVGVAAQPLEGFMRPAMRMVPGAFIAVAAGAGLATGANFLVCMCKINHHLKEKRVDFYL